MSDSPRSGSRRLRREARTIELMIRMRCADLHSPGDQGRRSPGSRRGTGRQHADLCPDCAALLDYSLSRIDACRFGAGKPTCAHCTVHCFRASMREQIRSAMRYSGPRMTYRHPYLAVRHLLDRTKEPGTRK